MAEEITPEVIQELIKGKPINPQSYYWIAQYDESYQPDLSRHYLTAQQYHDLIDAIKIVRYIQKFLNFDVGESLYKHFFGLMNSAKHYHRVKRIIFTTNTEIIQKYIKLEDPSIIELLECHIKSHTSKILVGLNRRICSLEETIEKLERNRQDIEPLLIQQVEQQQEKISKIEDYITEQQEKNFEKQLSDKQQEQEKINQELSNQLEQLRTDFTDLSIEHYKMKYELLKTIAEKDQIIANQQEMFKTELLTMEEFFNRRLLEMDNNFHRRLKELEK